MDKSLGSFGTHWIRCSRLGQTAGPALKKMLAGVVQITGRPDVPFHYGREGKCQKEQSGFEEPRITSLLIFDNAYFKSKKKAERTPDEESQNYRKLSESKTVETPENL
ncbi:hypothetical protein LguiB_000931 [Lonicera macranthoides]